MEKGKNILIFILINLFILGFTVVIPLLPTINFYKAYHYDIPKVGNLSFSKNMSIVVDELQTQEAKDAFKNFVEYMTESRVGILYESFTWVDVMLGILLGVSVIAIGILLKYKSSKQIYSLSFIVAGIIIVISYIFILSILLQTNVFYSL